jgi:two-component system, NtrC family, sensor histidine kinase PilS
MDTNSDSRRLGLFLPLRLASYVILMSVVVVWMDDPQYLRFPTIIYSILTLAFAVSLGLEKKYSLKGLTYVLIGLQSLLEISIESGVIYATGNVNSPFSALFVLTIVSAALVYRMVGTLVVASLVSLAYAFIIWLGLTGPSGSEISMQALKTIFLTHESVFYAIFLHILIFYLTAFISGYLAERLNSQDQKLVDASLALKRARLETDDILRHLNSGLLTIDSGGYIIYFNRAAERILGYSEEKVRGMLCREVFAERMPDLADYLMSGITSRVTYPRKELDIVNDKQEVMPLGLSSSILTEESGSLRGVIAIFSDLTEAKRMENKVRATDRLAAVGELSASIAHEIRNPLAAISGSVEVLNSELQLSNENARLMELIVRESHRLNIILSDFLAFSRISRPGYNKVELCHLVGDVRELLRLHENTPDNIEVNFESDESIVYVIGDEDHIKQMLVNLALNSCEAFEGRPGKLSFGINSNESQGTVDLYVRDNGPGIEIAIIDNIFTPFFSTKKQGTGLGLAIVHRICEALKLRLHVDSHPGEGTTFWLQFLVYTQERREVTEDPSARPSSAPAGL